MPHQLTHDARGLVQLALINAERHRTKLHPGVYPHLRAAYVQLDAACAALDARIPPARNTTNGC